jgi:ATP-dependent Zn proteases
MITEYGMSERLGARKFGHGDGEPFLGRDMSHSRDYSERSPPRSTRRSTG